MEIYFRGMSAGKTLDFIREMVPIERPKKKKKVQRKAKFRHHNQFIEPHIRKVRR